MRILTILARAGTEKYPTCEKELSALLPKLLPEAESDLIVVDNLLPPGAHERSQGRVVIGGDNSAWEFSAFDAGVRHAGEAIDRYDWIHFATSAFNTLYTDYLWCFRPAVLDACGRRGVCLGHIDYFNQPIRVCDYPSQHWVRTCFFMLPPSEVALLGSFVSVRDRRRFFSGDAAEPFRRDAPLSAVFRGYIRDWLTGKDIGQGMTWHSRFDLTPATVPLFEDKALAIVNEHLLGIRLRAAGCGLVDVTWLSSMLERGDEIDWGTSWRDQIADRAVPALAERAG